METKSVEEERKLASENLKGFHMQDRTGSFPIAQWNVNNHGTL